MKNWKKVIQDKAIFCEWDKKTLTRDDWDFHWLEEKKDKWIIYPWENKEVEGKYDRSFSV